MRAIRLFILLIGFSSATFGQQSGNAPTTLTGCLMSINGSFTLQTERGKRYTLKGDHDTLLRHNGNLVQVTGTPGTSQKAAARREFQVSSVKKLSDVCQ